MWNVVRSNRGFTLIELLMSIAILAVLTCIALPSYAKLIAHTHGQTARSDLSAALSLARMTAVARNSHVIACPSDDLTDCARTTHWQQGWIVFADNNHDGVRQAGEPIIGVNQAQPTGVAIIGTTGRLRVDYQPDGSASGSNITLTICDRGAEAADATALIINNAGRLRSDDAKPEAAEACLRAAG